MHWEQKLAKFSLTNSIKKNTDRIIAEINDDSDTKHIDHSELICFSTNLTQLYTTESLGNDSFFLIFF